MKKKRNKWNVQLVVLVLVALLFVTAYLLGSDITGFLVSGDYSRIVDKEFSTSENISLDVSDLTYFAVNGYVSRGFVGKVSLNDEVILDYRTPVLDENVPESSIDFDIIMDVISDDVVGLTALSPDSNEYMCTRWIINDEETCFGNPYCCLLVGIPVEEDRFDDVLYVNKGKYGSKDRNYVRAQVIIANYSLGVEEAYADVRHSDIKGKVVDLYAKKDLVEVCGDACIATSSSDYNLNVEIDSGSVYISNYSYKLTPNRAPEFSTLPNIRFSDSYVLDLSSYVEDRDGDELYFSYMDAPGINISFVGDKAVINSVEGFTGKTYTFFTVNDSKESSISNIFEINVLFPRQGGEGIGVIVHHDHTSLWPSEEAVINLLEREGYGVTLIDALCVVYDTGCPVGDSYAETANSVSVIVNPTLYSAGNCGGLGLAVSENTHQFGTPVLWYGYSHAYDCSSVDALYGSGSSTSQCVDEFDFGDDSHDVSKSQGKGKIAMQECKQSYWIKDFVGKELSGKKEGVLFKTNLKETSLGVIMPDDTRTDGAIVGGRVVIFGAHDELTKEGEEVFMDSIEWLGGSK